jgi:hypothetical protein
MLMDTSHFGAGAFRDRFASRRKDVVWLYDPITEEFLQDPGIPLGRTLDIGSRSPSALLLGRPGSRWGRLAYGLFVQGWMCPIFIGGLMILPVIAWQAGFH